MLPNKRLLPHLNIFKSIQHFKLMSALSVMTPAHLLKVCPISHGAQFFLNHPKLPYSFSDLHGAPKSSLVGDFPTTGPKETTTISQTSKIVWHFVAGLDKEGIPMMRESKMELIN
jgi:hypothetical protein